MKFALKKLETSFRSIVLCKMRFAILNRLRVDDECDGRTDGRTDGQVAVSNCVLL